MYAISEEEYKKGTAPLNGNAAGIDDILVKQLKDLRPKLGNTILLAIL